MSDRRVRVAGMAEAIEQSMADYAALSNEVMKECVADESKSVKKDIQDNAPVKSGRYKRSWTAGKQTGVYRMNQEQVMTMLVELNLPFAYDHFGEGQSLEPPFCVFLYPGARNFSADGLPYFKVNRLHLELYTDLKSADRREGSPV